MKQGMRCVYLLAGLGLCGFVPQAAGAGSSTTIVQEPTLVEGVGLPRHFRCAAGQSSSGPQHAATLEVAFRVHGEAYPDTDWTRLAATPSARIPVNGEAGVSIETEANFIVKDERAPGGHVMHMGSMLLGARVCVRSVADGSVPVVRIQVTTARFVDATFQDGSARMVGHPDVLLADGTVAQGLVPGQWQRLDYADGEGTFDRKTWIEARLVRVK